MFIPLQATPNAGGGAGSFWLMLLLLFAIMYFFMIRPQNKQRKELEAFQNSLQPGCHVITTGGIYGVVKEVLTENGKTIILLEIATGVKIRIDKSSVYADPAYAPKPEPKKSKKEEKAEAKKD